MPTIFTFHPEQLQRGVKLSACIIRGWRPTRLIAIEARGAEHQGYKAVLTQRQFEMFRKVLWFTYDKGDDYMHNGVRIDVELTVKLVAQAMYRSESGAYRMLEGLVTNRVLEKERRGRRYYYRVIT